MAIRELIEKNSKFVVPILLLVAIAAVVFGLSSGPNPSDIFNRDKWMFDLTNGTLVRASADTPAPTEGAGTFDYGVAGKAGSLVDAVVYSCGDPAVVRDGMTVQELVEVGAHVGYLRIDDFTAGVSSDSTNGDEEPVVGRRLVSSVDGSRWVPEESGPGRSLRERVAELCGGTFPKQVLP